jgi:hypothetical protein
VFFQSANTVGSPIMRETAFLQLTSIEGQHVDVDQSVMSTQKLYQQADESQQIEEATPKAFDFDLGGRVAYQEFLTSNADLNNQHRLFINAAADAVANPGGPVSLVIHDLFFRTDQSPDLEQASTINRDDNRGQVGVRYHAAGKDFDDTLSYENWYETFENTAAANGYPTRMNQTISLTHNWWPSDDLTFSGQLSHGFYGAVGEASEALKPSSQPDRVIAGFVKYNHDHRLSFRGHVGYAHASYSMGEGYSSPIGGAEARFDWSNPGQIGRVSVLYDYDHFDSFQANFYRDHLLAAKLVQQFNWVIFDGGPEIRQRFFGGIPMEIGPPSRSDWVYAVRARAQVVLGERYALSAEYRLADVHTDYRGVGDTNPSFVENQFTVGVWAAY